MEAAGEPSIYAAKPAPFLTVRVQNLDLEPTVRGFCTGYEKGTWRNDGLAGYLFEYLPEFALRYDELGPKGHEEWVARLAEAAKTVYTTEKFQRRGEFGELLLHAVIREIWDSEPAVSKIYYKDGPNDTVKGFDAVHLVCPDEGDLEILLGEVKFFKSIDSAMTKVAKELRDHFNNTNWLKAEFAAVTRKVDPEWPRAEEFKDLLHRRKSLDEIASRLRVPVLLTYESECVAANARCDDKYSGEFDAEILALREQFAGKNLPVDVVIDLLLVPLHQKNDLIKALNKRLTAWQGIA
jgi:uncharacterized protein DUF1837